MANCAYCNSFILFRGVQADGRKFCNAKCRENGMYLSIAQRIPESEVTEVIALLERKGCPKCKGPGPIEVHTAHSVWSLIVLTSWQSRPQMSCRKCGVKRQLGSAAFSALVGWWGFPWGLLITPIQIGRNIHGMFNSPAHPSDQLKRIIGLSLAKRIVAGQKAQNARQAVPSIGAVQRLPPAPPP